MYVAQFDQNGKCIGVGSQRTVGKNQLEVDSLDYAGLTYDWDTQLWSGTVEVPVPVYRLQLTLREFILMLTPQELRLIEVKTKTDDDIMYFWEVAKAELTIDLETLIAIGGMAKLVEKNVLSQARHDEIMLGVPL